MSSNVGSGISRYLPWAIAGIAVAVLAVTLMREPRAPQHAAAGDDAAKIAELSARLAALESARSQQGPRGMPVRSIPQPGSAGQGGATADVAMSPQEQEAQRQRELQELEAQFARDAADPATGPTTETALSETVAGPDLVASGLRPRDVDIACRQSTCRTVGTFDRRGDAEDWSLFYVTAAGGQLLSETRMVFVPLPDGSTEARIYSARP